MAALADVHEARRSSWRLHGAQFGVVQAERVVVVRAGRVAQFDIGAHCQGLAVVVEVGDSCRAKQFFSAIDFAYQRDGQSSCEPVGLVAGEGHMAGAVRQLGASAYSWPPALPSATRFDHIRGSRKGQTQHYAAR